MRLKLSTAVCLLSLSACTGPCGSELLSVAKSPDGNRAAALVEVNCGATTDYAYEVRVSKGGVTPAGGEVALRFDAGHNGADWPEDKRQLVNLTWDHSILHVLVSRPVRIFKRESVADGITVRFRFHPGTTTS